MHSVGNCGRSEYLQMSVKPSSEQSTGLTHMLFLALATLDAIDHYLGIAVGLASGDEISSKDFTPNLVCSQEFPVQWASGVFVLGGVNLDIDVLIVGNTCQNWQCIFHRWTRIVVKCHFSIFL